MKKKFLIFKNRITKTILCLLFVFLSNYSLADNIQNISNVKSITLDFCNIYIESPFSITPHMFDSGAFELHRDTVLVSDIDDIKDFINIIKGLKCSNNNFQNLDTRGKITITFFDNYKTEMYFDSFLLLCDGLYYDIQNSRIINEIYKLTNKYSLLKNNLFSFLTAEIDVSIKVPECLSVFRRNLKGYNEVELVFENGAKITISIKDIPNWRIDRFRTQTTKSHTNYLYSSDKKRKKKQLVRHDKYKFRNAIVSISYMLTDKSQVIVFNQIIDSIWINKAF